MKAYENGEQGAEFRIPSVKAAAMRQEILAIAVKNPYNQVPEECKGADPEREWCP